MSTAQVLDSLSQWKKKKFRPAEMSLTKVVDSLATEEPLIEAKPGRVLSRWILSGRGSDTPAVLVHAALWRWGSNMETGNYVPSTEKAIGVTESRLQTEPSFKCELSYTFDTMDDPSLFKMGQASSSLELDRFVAKHPDFNRSGKNRRIWQNGKIAAESQRFIMTCPLFSKRTSFNHSVGQPFRVPYQVHPWIQSALEEPTNSKWIPNPERPRLLAYENDKLIDLKDSDPPNFEPGDIIWFSFNLTYTVGNEAWAPEYRLINLVRVGRIPNAFASKSDPSMYPQTSPPLELGEVQLLDEDSDVVEYVGNLKAEVTAGGMGSTGSAEVSVPAFDAASGDDAPLSKGRNGSSEEDPSTASSPASASKPSGVKRSAETADDDAQPPAKRRVFKVKGK